MAGDTPATRVLRTAGVPFTLARYAYDPAADSIGLAAAEALGEPPARVLKTLMVKADGRPACAILPSDRTLSMKRLAMAAGAKTAEMMPAVEAERMTGYKVGGISPFGQRKRMPIFLDAAALMQPYVFVNGGQRGLQVKLLPSDLVTITQATVAPVMADI